MISFTKFCNLSNSSKFSFRNYSIRIGCASGFWGDTNVAAPQLIKHGNLDYLIFDYLSEITMSLLAKMKMKDISKGYTPDFFNIARYAKDIKSQNLKVVANAGGINPDACYQEMIRVLNSAGVDLKVAVVNGDNILNDSDKIHQIVPNDLPDNVLSSNVYLGAYPIKRALDYGADIVITGRCTDSALALGPLWHKFNWNSEEYDKLALGSLAGHLIECGAQATGGIFTDNHLVSDWWNIGFPIVEINDNADSILVTKPPKTGGLVSKGTVAEQLLYEIGDPAQYMLPDVICDFRNVSIEEVGENQVLVRDVKGKAPTDTYKVSSTYIDKYRLTGVAILIGSDAVSKGYRTANEILKRVKMILKTLKMEDFTRTKVQVIGAEESYGSMKNETTVQACREVAIWIAAEHSDKRALSILASEIAPAGTGMAPGLTGMVGGRPKVSPIVRLHSSFLHKSVPEITISLNGDVVETLSTSDKVSEKRINNDEVTANTGQRLENTNNATKSQKRYKLSELVWARSGDKGDLCNIGVIARNDEAWDIIRDRLSADKVASVFQHFMDPKLETSVKRYELPGVKALNFVLPNSLGGGGISSLNVDPQGKAYAQILLDLVI